MSNTNLRRGNRWAADVCRALVAAGFRYAEPRKAGAEHDTGDVAGLPGVVIECKRWKSIDLAGWVDQTRAEVATAKADFGVVWAHRRGKSKPEDGYVICDGATFLYLLGEAGYK